MQRLSHKECHQRGDQTKRTTSHFSHRITHTLARVSQCFVHNRAHQQKNIKRTVFTVQRARTHTHNRYKTYCIFSIKLRTESRPIRIDLCSRFLLLSCFADFGCVSLQIGLKIVCLRGGERGFAPVDAVELNVSVRLDIGGSAVTQTTALAGC